MSAVLQLTGAKFQVSLGRLWARCEAVPSSCDGELKHLVAEAVKIAKRPEHVKPTADRVYAVVRPKEYLDSLAGDSRTDALFEPLVADLIVVYVFDEGGAVRLAQRKDLAELGMTQAELFAAARRNLAARLPVPEGQPNCRPHALGAWDSGNYYESSRLLLTDFWQEMASRTKLRIVAAAPGVDTVLVGCDPTPTELAQLSAMVEQRFHEASRAVSTTLLTWTPSGWQRLSP